VTSAKELSTSRQLCSFAAAARYSATSAHFGLLVISIDARAQLSEVTVRGDQDDDLSMLLERKAGNVQTYPHVYALLPNIRLQIIGVDLHCWTRPVKDLPP
jgi:hypothetical protein